MQRRESAALAVVMCGVANPSVDKRSTRDEARHPLFVVHPRENRGLPRGASLGKALRRVALQKGSGNPVSMRVPARRVPQTRMDAGSSNRCTAHDEQDDPMHYTVAPSSPPCGTTCGIRRWPRPRCTCTPMMSTGRVRWRPRLQYRPGEGGRSPHAPGILGTDPRRPEIFGGSCLEPLTGRGRAAISACNAPGRR